MYRARREDDEKSLDGVLGCRPDGMNSFQSVEWRVRALVLGFCCSELPMMKMFWVISCYAMSWIAIHTRLRYWSEKESKRGGEGNVGCESVRKNEIEGR